MTDCPVTRFSPTALNTYISCPRRWDWQFRQRIEFEEAPSPNLFMGKLVHVALAGLHKLPVGVRNEAMAHQLLRSAWGKAERAGLFLSDEDEIIWGQRALRALSNYCAEWQLDVRPLAIESWVRHQLPGGPLLNGKADRVDVARSDQRLIEVVDYKTGKCRLSGDELSAEPAAQLYAVAATKTFGRRVSRVRFIFLEEPCEIEWRLEPEDLKVAEGRLARRAAEILADHTLRPTPGFHCRWCPFVQICDARDEGAAEAPADEQEVPF